MLAHHCGKVVSAVDEKATSIQDWRKDFVREVMPQINAEHEKLTTYFAERSSAMHDEIKGETDDGGHLTDQEYCKGARILLADNNNFTTDILKAQLVASEMMVSSVDLVRAANTAPFVPSCRAQPLCI